MTDFQVARDALALGKDCVKSGKLEEASRYYELCAAAYGFHDEAKRALTNRGIVLRKLNCPQQALECFEQVLQRDRHFPKARWNRCLALREVARFGDALKELREFELQGISGVKPAIVQAEIRKTKKMLEEYAKGHRGAAAEPPSAGEPMEEVSQTPPSASPPPGPAEDGEPGGPPSRGSNIVPLHFSPGGSPLSSPTISAAEGALRNIAEGGEEGEGEEGEEERKSPSHARMSLDRQREIVTRSMEQWLRRGLRKSDPYYVVDGRWWRLWCFATGYDGPSAPERPDPATQTSPSEDDVDYGTPQPAPVELEEAIQRALGPIPNHSLVDSEKPPAAEDSGPHRLRPGLRLGDDAELLSQEAWQALQACYGGGPPLPRVVVDLQEEEEKDAAADAGKDWHKLEATEDSKDAEEEDGEEGGVDDPNLSSLVDPTRFIVDLYPERREAERIKRSEMARTGHAVTATGGDFSTWARGDVFDDAPDVFANRGLVGLDNLGNTCFMNAAIQCVSASWPLTAFFLAGRDQEDLNEDNPLGTGGSLAREFAHLIRLMWIQDRRYAGGIAPTGLKRAVGRFRREFQGFAQQDSHELLSFLLDGIHEDLNRIRKKPYVENAEAGDRPDEAVAAEAWQKYQMRNRSIIVDHMSGLLKSTLVCPECGFVSRTFDPFTSLSLPLPAPRKVAVMCTFFFAPRRPHDDTHMEICTKRLKATRDYYGRVTPAQTLELPTRRRRLGVLMNRSDPIGLLRERVAAEMGVPPENVLLGTYVGGRINAVLKDSTTVGNVYDPGRSVLAAYEVVDEPANEPDPFDPPQGAEGAEEEGGGGGGEEGEGEGEVGEKKEMLHVFPMLLMQDSRFGYMDEKVPLKDLRPQGLPMCISVPRRATCRSLRRRILEHLRPTIVPLEGQTDDELAESLPLFVRPSLWQHGRKGRVPFTDMPVEDIFEPKASSCVCGFARRPPWDDRFDAEAYDATIVLPSTEEAKEAAEQQVVTLADCFEEFTEPEVLDERNTWFCSNCKEHVCATKTMQIWSLPDVLIVQFKRFQNRGIFFTRKLDTPVDYPLANLDLSPLTMSHRNKLGHDTRVNAEKNEAELADEAAAQGGGGVPAPPIVRLGEEGEEHGDVPRDVDSVYDLFGVVNHYGDLGFGHYTAYANRYAARYGDGEDGGGGGPDGTCGTEDEAARHWHEFDDARVRPIAARSVVHGDAYLLFYRRRGARFP